MVMAANRRADGVGAGRASYAGSIELLTEPVGALGVAQW